MSYKVLVVDDEKEAQKRLLLYLKRFDGLQLLEPNNNGEEALNTIQNQAPDIVFLDVEMPEMNGIEVLANCEGSCPYIIFVTAYSQYAIEAFEQNAIDYILKPYTFERIKLSLDRAIKMIEKDRLSKINENFKDLLFSLSKNVAPSLDTEYIKRIAAKSVGKTTFISVDEIIHIEAADQYIEVYTEKKKYTVRESMDKLEKNLNPKFFFRTHRSYIVNLECVAALEHVDKHTSLVVLRNSKKLKIANSRKQAFKDRMNVSE